VRNFWSSLLFTSIQSVKEYRVEFMSFKRNKRQLFETNLRNCELYSLPRHSATFIDTNIFVILISNNLSAEFYLTYCLKRSARIGACRFESFWFPTVYKFYNRMLAFTFDFQLSLALKYLRKNVMFCIWWDKENILLQNLWTSQVLTRFWRCDACSLNKVLLTFVS
jgi:hypothetical protein